MLGSGGPRADAVTGGASRSASVALALERPARRSSSSSTTPRGRWSSRRLIDGAVARARRPSQAAGADRRGAGHRHDQAGGRRRARSAHGAARRTLGDPDAAGLPRRSAAQRARRRPERSPRRPTTPGWSRRPGGTRADPASDEPNLKVTTPSRPASWPSCVLLARPRASARAGSVQTTAIAKAIWPKASAVPKFAAPSSCGERGDARRRCRAGRRCQASGLRHRAACGLGAEVAAATQRSPALRAVVEVGACGGARRRGAGSTAWRCPARKIARQVDGELQRPRRRTRAHSP